MPTLKLTLPHFALPARRGGSPRVLGGRALGARHDPLPPVVAVEGTPDPSLRAVIEAAAARLGAVVCGVDDVRSLPRDPDFDSVVAVVLTRPRPPRAVPHALAETQRLLGHLPVVAVAPWPLSQAVAGSLPVEPALLSPPLTVEGLLFALGQGAAARS